MRIKSHFREVDFIITKYCFLGVLAENKIYRYLEKVCSNTKLVFFLFDEF